MSLFVNGGESFQRQVRTALQLIDPSIDLVNGRVFLDHVHPYSGHQRGHELMRRLVVSGFEVRIRYGGRCRCDPQWEHAGRQGSKVYWNPSHVAMLPTTRGMRPCPGFIALGHELCHSDQLIRGIPSTADLFPAPGSSRGFSLRLELLNIRGFNVGSDRDPEAVTENQLRHEANLPMRENY